MHACLARLSKAQGPGKSQDHNKEDDNKEYELSQEDIESLQKLAKLDPLIRGLIASSDIANALGRILGLGAVGPMKLVVKWDQALIRGWRQANAAIDQQSKAVACEMISFHQAATKEIQYFDELYKACGYDQY